MELAHKAVFAYRKAVALSHLYQKSLDQIVKRNGTDYAYDAVTQVCHSVTQSLSRIGQG